MKKEILLSVVFLLGFVLAEMPRDVVSHYEIPGDPSSVPVALATIEDEAPVGTANRPVRLVATASGT